MTKPKNEYQEPLKKRFCVICKNWTATQFQPDCPVCKYPVFDYDPIAVKSSNEMLLDEVRFLRRQNVQLKNQANALKRKLKDVEKNLENLPPENYHSLPNEETEFDN